MPCGIKTPPGSAFYCLVTCNIFQLSGLLLGKYLVRFLLFPVSDVRVTDAAGVPDIFCSAAVRFSHLLLYFFIIINLSISSFRDVKKLP